VVPPRQLRIKDYNPDVAAHNRSTKKPQQVQPGPSSSSPYGPPYPYLYPLYHIPQTNFSSPSSRNQRRFNIPSSDPIEELEDPTLFPRIGSWLQELDDGIRGSDNHNFAQYTAALDDNRFTRIFQLEDLSDSLRLVYATIIHDNDRIWPREGVHLSKKTIDKPSK